MAVSGSYTRGLRNHARNHSGFTLLPTRVSSGPTSPPTTFPAAFCTAWQEAQNDSPYKLAPAVGSGAFWSFSLSLLAGLGGARSPRVGVLVPARCSRWHCPQEDCTYRAGKVGCSQASVLL